jgi:hypothetical protein
MVNVTIDGKKYIGKVVIIDEWSGHSKKEFTHCFSDEYDEAENILKNR